MTGIKQELARFFEEQLKAQQRVSLLRKKSSLSFDDNSEESKLLQSIEPQNLQKKIRPIYSKKGINQLKIGDHPDFQHLQGGGSEFCGIISVFMDMVGSTKLCRRFDLDDVFIIKNSYISTATSLVLAFDGHVHRIMGDAVLAFFGGKSINNDQGAVDALNFASIMMVYAQEIVAPYLKELGFDDNFGIRIGIDYGKKESVLWKRYGFVGMDEITATSFYVDIASKLQHNAPKNHVMIGDSFKKHLDIPKEVLKDPTDDYVISFLDANRNQLNYRQYLFLWDKYFNNYNPALHSVQELCDTRIELSIHNSKESIDEDQVGSCSKIVDKNKWIKFRIFLPPHADLYPIEIDIKIINNGIEAYEESPEDGGSHSSSLTIVSPNKNPKIHWEHTKYRGLHYAIISYRTKHQKSLNKNEIGIFIK